MKKQKPQPIPEPEEKPIDIDFFFEDFTPIKAQELNKKYSANPFPNRFTDSNEKKGND